MKEKNGFTLIELLAVIAIIGLLIGIAVPSTLLISKNIKEKLYESKLKNIEVAVEHYLEDHKNNCGYIDILKQNLTIKELVDNNYLKPDSNKVIKNPIDDTNWYEKNTKIKELAKDADKLNVPNAEEAIKLDEICNNIKNNADKEANATPGETGGSTSENLLRNKILENGIVNTIESKIVPNFNISEPPKKGLAGLGSGLYGTNGKDDKPTYYFRGAVEKNYVQFGKYKMEDVYSYYYIEDNEYEDVISQSFASLEEAEHFCESNGTDDYQVWGYSSEKNCRDKIGWKELYVNSPMIWRIVRINEDGTIRMILSDGIGSVVSAFAFTTNNDYKCTNDTPCEVTYNNGDFSNDKFGGKNSTIKDKLERWYKNTLSDSSLNSHIASTTFCNNMSNGSITTSCLDPSENNGGVYKTKIGLITEEEARMAGVETISRTNYLDSIEKKDYSEKNYFYNIDTYTMSNRKIINRNGLYIRYRTLEDPISEGLLVKEFVENIDNNINQANSKYGSHNIHPVINLKADTKVIGSGTRDDPYIIQE